MDMRTTQENLIPSATYAVVHSPVLWGADSTCEAGLFCGGLVAGRLVLFFQLWCITSGEA